MTSLEIYLLENMSTRSILSSPPLYITEFKYQICIYCMYNIYRGIFCKILMQNIDRNVTRQHAQSSCLHFSPISSVDPQSPLPGVQESIIYPAVQGKDFAFLSSSTFTAFSRCPYPKQVVEVVCSLYQKHILRVGSLGQGLINTTELKPPPLEQVRTSSKVNTFVID